MQPMFTAGMGIFTIFYFIFMLAYLVIGIYVLVLFIKLATRGIKALDIYIGKENKSKAVIGGEHIE